MNRFQVHTNIALDYPANRTGNIYTSTNIKTLFNNSKFRNKIAAGALYGTFNYPVLEFAKDKISHVVRDAFISDDMEIMFEIETLINDEGRALRDVLIQSEFGALAKMVAKLSKGNVDGKLKVLDIAHVHMVNYEPSYFKKN